jgi:hypothetical protein
MNMEIRKKHYSFARISIYRGNISACRGQDRTRIVCGFEAARTRCWLGSFEMLREYRAAVHMGSTAATSSVAAQGRSR